MAIFPFYLAEHGVDAGLIAAGIAAFYMGRLLFQYPVGVLADRVDRRTLLAILATIIVAVMIVGALPGGGEGRFMGGDAGVGGQGFALLLMMLLGGTVFPMYSVASGLAYGRAGDEPLIEISKTLLVLNSIGAVMGPIFVGLIAPVFGFRSLHLSVFVVATIAAAVALFRRAAAPAPEEKIVGVVAAPQTSIEMVQAAAEATLEDKQ